MKSDIFLNVARRNMTITGIIFNTKVCTIQWKADHQVMYCMTD